MRNTLFPLQRSITQNYMLIMYTKESLVSHNWGIITQNYVTQNHSVFSKVYINFQKWIKRENMCKDICDTTKSNLIGYIKYFQIESKFVFGDRPTLCREKK